MEYGSTVGRYKIRSTSTEYVAKFLTSCAPGSVRRYYSDRKAEAEL